MFYISFEIAGSHDYDIYVLLSVRNLSKIYFIQSGQRRGAKKTPYLVPEFTTKWVNERCAHAYTDVWRSNTKTDPV